MFTLFFYLNPLEIHINMSFKKFFLVFKHRLINGDSKCEPLGAAKYSNKKSK